LPQSDWPPLPQRCFDGIVGISGLNTVPQVCAPVERMRSERGQVGERITSEAEMCSCAGPAPILCVLGETRLYRVIFDVPNCNHEVRIAHRVTFEATLE
jgi:hypothetical protein